MEELTLGMVVKAVPLVYVEGWRASDRQHRIVTIHFDWEGMEEAIGRAMFSGAPIVGLRFSVPDGDGSVQTVGVWRA